MATSNPLQDLPQRRSYFYVGGQYVNDNNGTGGKTMQGQMYVEELKHPFPLVFIHGAAQTATVRLLLSAA